MIGTAWVLSAMFTIKIGFSERNTQIQFPRIQLKYDTAVPSGWKTIFEFKENVECFISIRSAGTHVTVSSSLELQIPQQFSSLHTNLRFSLLWNY